MTAGWPLGADGPEALATDRYLDALLAADERRADDAPAGLSLDPAMRSTALRLRAELVRVHPSFRFEDRLARRLAAAASLPEAAAAPAGETRVAGAPTPDLPAAAAARPDGTLIPFDRGARAPQDRDVRFGGPDRRPLLVGGAVTSAALSLAGAAFIAWRLTHGSSVDPMSRAVRLVRGGRELLPRAVS